MSEPISLVSLNIEGRKHLERITPFLNSVQPDVVCLQELCKQDVEYFERVLNTKGYFAPMHYTAEWNDEQGLGIFTAFPFKAEAIWYAGQKGGIPVSAGLSSLEQRYCTMQFKLVIAHIEKNGKKFTIGNTHLPVTENAEVTEYQREALAGMFTALENYNEIVFCGDFNAPRGREIFSEIAAKYKDNVPSGYTTSLDGSIHRAGPLPYMVDGLFSTPGYEVANVRMLCGVSDHCAIIANISRK